MSDDEYWVCACVKRRGDQLTHIRQHPKTVAKCKRCGATRESAEKLAKAAKRIRERGIDY